MKTARVYCAGVILGATLVIAAWLYTHRAWETRITRSEGVVEVEVTPWWAVLGAYLLPFLGAGVSVWLLPGSRRLFKRFIARLTTVFSAKPS